MLQASHARARNKAVRGARRPAPARDRVRPTDSCLSRFVRFVLIHGGVSVSRGRVIYDMVLLLVLYLYALSRASSPQSCEYETEVSIIISLFT